MKFFDYKRLYEEAGGDSTKIVRLFQKAPSEGTAFIINPHIVREGMGYSNRVLAEYLGLCALRRYDNYVYFNEVDLPIYLLPPWIPLNVVQENPLIKLTEQKIEFKEEKDLWELTLTT